MDDSTLRRYYDIYVKKGMDGLSQYNYSGGLSLLSELETKNLDRHLQANTYQTSKEIAFYIEKQYGVEITSNGVRGLLHRMNFVFKKMKHLPGKGDVKAQKTFVKKYNRLKADKGKEDNIYFIDGVHPLHNSIVANGWIKKGTEKGIQANTGRQRLNINGACNAATGNVIIHEDVCINAQSTMTLFDKLQQAQPKGKIIAISDNARYYRCRLLEEYLENNTRIELIFLPPYSPNLNLIERVWKFYKKKVLYNKYYETYDEFKKQTFTFFENIDDYKIELNSLLRDKFYFPNQIYS
jgi:transposase